MVELASGVDEEHTAVERDDPRDRRSMRVGSISIEEVTDVDDGS